MLRLSGLVMTRRGVTRKGRKGQEETAAKGARQGNESDEQLAEEGAAGGTGVDGTARRDAAAVEAEAVREMEAFIRACGRESPAEVMAMV